MGNVLIFMIIGYLSGSVLYSRLIARYILHVDISTVGDGNPGTTNVGKVGGAKWALIAFVLDVLKSAIPVGIAHFGFGIQDWRIAFIAITPAIGHAYPLFFGFKGGKGIATIAGGWVGIAIWEIITVGGLLLLLWYKSIRESAWVTIFMLLCTGVYLVLTGKPLYWYSYWVLCLVFLLWTHRRELPNPPGVQLWVKNLASRIWQSHS